MTIARLAQITFNCTDPLPLARWWAARIGGEITHENDGWFVVVQAPHGPALAFQKVEHASAGANRLHLDLLVEDVPATVQEYVAAGAVKVDEHTMGDFGWTILRDPDGNEFCLAARH